MRTVFPVSKKFPNFCTIAFSVSEKLFLQNLDNKKWIWVDYPDSVIGILLPVSKKLCPKFCTIKRIWLSELDSVRGIVFLVLKKIVFPISALLNGSRWAIRIQFENCVPNLKKIVVPNFAHLNESGRLPEFNYETCVLVLEKLFSKLLYN